MHHLFGGGSQRGLPAGQAGSTILAALLLVVTVGVFSTVLHYGQSLNDHLTYQSQQLTAQAAATGPCIGTCPTAPTTIPANTGATPSGTTGATKPPSSEEKKSCSDNSGEGKGLQAPSSSGSGSSANSGAAKIEAKCLPGCKYDARLKGTDTMQLQARATPEKSEPGKPCVMCLAGKCYSQEVSASGEGVSGSKPMACDAKGENCTQEIDMDNWGKSTTEQLAAATKLTREMAAASTPEQALQMANQAMQSGQVTPTALQEAVENQKTALSNQWNADPTSQSPTGETAKAYGNMLAVQEGINAFAGPTGGGAGGGSVPAPSGDEGSGFNYPSNWYTKQVGITGQPGGGNTPAPIPTPGPGGTPAPSGIPNTSFGGLGGLGGGGMTSGIMSFLSGMMRGMGYGGMGGYGGTGGYGAPPGNTIPQAPGSCNTQYLCSGQTLFYRNNQCVDQPMQQCPYGCNGNQCAQQQNGQQGQYGYGTDGQSCMQPPVQPNAATCTTGTWKPTSSTNNGCTTGWQCVADGSSTAAPIASLSCQSQVADVGSVFALSYSCQRAVDSMGGGFDTRGQLTGATSVTIGDPPAGTNTATYTLGCRNVVGLVVGAQCSVQINKPLIALTAHPASVPSGATSTVGWVTGGMQSCVVSSPDNAAFTDQNAGSTNVNGVAVTPPLTSTTRIQLTCTTFGGGTRATSTTIGVFSE